ncbi:MAG: holo-ACP synthase [Candidatus Omnitrophica bacterium]|nr:holo-ACP synthase [Candidatus Omnitrophota bacterium]
MIIGTGVDIVEVSRIKSAAIKWKKNFLKKIFTDKELKYSEQRSVPYQHLAARFAAKEAVLKALGNGWTNRVEWRDIEVWNESSGKPNVRLSGQVKKVSNERGVDDILISVSHTRTYAVANVILIKDEARTKD